VSSNNLEMMEALQALAVDKGISTDALLGALADALESAYKRTPGAHEYSWVTIAPDTFEIRVNAQELDEEGEPEGPELDVTPDDFGRIAAQTAKQVMFQRIREIDRDMKYEEYAGREGDIVTGMIQQSDARYTLLDLGRVEALLPQAEQVPYERPAWTPPPPPHEPSQIRETPESPEFGSSGSLANSSGLSTSGSNFPPVPDGWEPDGVTRPSHALPIAIALAIAVPVSLLIGAIIGFIVRGQL
jgi:hypothetical protein